MANRIPIFPCSLLKKRDHRWTREEVKALLDACLTLRPRLTARHTGSGGSAKDKEAAWKEVTGGY